MVKHKDWIYLSRLAEQATSPEERQRILDELDRLEFEEQMYFCQKENPHPRNPFN